MSIVSHIYTKDHMPKEKMQQINNDWRYNIHECVWPIRVNDYRSLRYSIWRLIRVELIVIRKQEITTKTSHILVSLRKQYQLRSNIYLPTQSASADSSTVSESQSKLYIYIYSILLIFFNLSLIAGYIGWNNPIY